MPITLEEISPEQAKNLLNGCRMKRPVNGERVDAYAKKMADGKWQSINAIVIKGKEVLDGQQRLHACVKADTPFHTMVIR